MCAVQRLRGKGSSVVLLCVVGSVIFSYEVLRWRPSVGGVREMLAKEASMRELFCCCFYALMRRFGLELKTCN